MHFPHPLSAVPGRPAALSQEFWPDLKRFKAALVIQRHRRALLARRRIEGKAFCFMPGCLATMGCRSGPFNYYLCKYLKRGLFNFCMQNPPSYLEHMASIMAGCYIDLPYIKHQYSKHMPIEFSGQGKEHILHARSESMLSPI